MGLLKNVIKAAQAFKAGFVGNINNRIVGVKQKIYRIIQPLLVKVSGGSLIKAALEGAADIFLGQPRLLAEKVQPLLSVI